LNQIETKIDNAEPATFTYSKSREEKVTRLAWCLSNVHILSPHFSGVECRFLFLLLSLIYASAHQRQWAIIKETNTALNSTDV